MEEEGRKIKGGWLVGAIPHSVLGLPDILSNQILDLVLDDSIRNDDATIVKFEEVSAKNEVTGKILADVFGYLVRSWTKIVRKIQSRECFDCMPYLTGYNEIQVPDSTKDQWRKYFGLTEELEWFNLFDEDEASSPVVIDQQLDSRVLDEDEEFPILGDETEVHTD